ncbi:hypothetical protein Scep_016374 [Stephania cephalantha]|uniref:F-box domain-containing protein n=1 Tax=Stephania cephalantha TaxID=152367 RepID=A0AAP0IMJ7_9MAGN
MVGIVAELVQSGVGAVLIFALKFMRMGMMVVSLESLPLDFIIDVLTEVDKSSLTDLFNASLICKTIKSLSENDKIYRHIHLITLALTAMDVNTFVVQFFRKCYTLDNLEAIFFKGMTPLSLLKNLSQNLTDFSMSRSRDRFLSVSLFVSLSRTARPSNLFDLCRRCRNLSLKPINRCTVCRRCESSSRPPEVVPPPKPSPTVAAASEAIVVYIASLAAAAQCPPPPVSLLVRRVSETSPLAGSLRRAAVRSFLPLSPLFVGFLATIVASAGGIAVFVADRRVRSVAVFIIADRHWWPSLAIALSALPMH